MSNETTRDLLKELRRKQDSCRNLATMSLPGWVEYRTEMSGRWGQLADAVEAGLFDQLDADLPTEAFVDVADAERYAQRDEYVNGDVAESEAVAYVEAARDVDPDGSRGPAVAEDRDACTICGRDFTEEQDAEDDQRQVVASTLYAHAACVESEAV